MKSSISNASPALWRAIARSRRSGEDMRNSSEERLDQELNSLRAQCEA